MIQLEYHVEIENRAFAGTTVMNKLGEEGWELVSVTTDIGAERGGYLTNSVTQSYFKRPKKPK